jgi:hypothetical protein
MGLFSKTTDTVEKVSKVIDSFVFTKEEKAEVQKSMQQVVVDYAAKTFDGSTIRSKARRFLAYLFCCTFVMVILAILFSYFLKMENIAQLLEVLEILSPAIVAIIIFYFGSYGVQSLINSKNK